MSYELDPDVGALALMTADVHYRMDSNYHRALNSTILDGSVVRPEFDKKDVRTAERKIRSQEARNILTFIWRSSDYITEEALFKAGYKVDAINRSLKSNSLATDFIEQSGISDPSVFQAIKQDVTKIVKCAYLFSLIEYGNDPVHKTHKPFKGTELLHRLMLQVHVKNAKLIKGLSDIPASGLKRAGS